MNLAAPDSEPKLLTEETLAATDRTGGDKTEVSSVQRAMHSTARTWAEALPIGRVRRSKDAGGPEPSRLPEPKSGLR